MRLYTAQLLTLIAPLLLCVSACGGQGLDFKPPVEPEESADMAEDTSSVDTDPPIDLGPDTPPEPMCPSPCQAPTAVCDLDTLRCVGCLQDADCAQPALLHVTFACEPSTQTCSYQCESDTWVVSPGASIEQEGCQCSPAPEACDGLDNDCDGEVDEGLPSLTCVNQEGVCQGAQVSCQGELSAYSNACARSLYEAHAPASYESDPLEALRCDGLDNDCDGEVDEACCAQDTPPSTTRIATFSAESEPQLVRATPARQQAAYMVAYRSASDTIQLIELNESLQEVWRGRHRFTQGSITSFSIVAAPQGYVLAVTIGQPAELTYYSIPATHLTTANSESLLSSLTGYSVTWNLDAPLSTPRVRLLASGDQLVMLTSRETAEIISGSERPIRYWTHCRSTFSSIGTDADECSRIFGHKEAFDSRVVNINDRYELDVAQRGEDALISWYHMSASRNVDVEKVTVMRMDDTDLKQVNLYYEHEGVISSLPLPYRRTLLWRSDTSASIFYRQRSGAERRNLYASFATRPPNPSGEFATSLQESSVQILAATALDLSRDGASDATLTLFHNELPSSDAALRYRVRRDATPLIDEHAGVLFPHSTRMTSRPTLLLEKSGRSVIGLIVQPSQQRELDLFRISLEGVPLCAQ